MKTKRTAIGIICLTIMMLLSFCSFIMVEQVSAETTAQTAESDFTIHNGLVTYTGEATGTVVIPSSINGETVQGLAANSFRSKLLTEVVIPETVTIISARAFSDCKMLQIITWESGTASLSIAAGAFNKCSSLESVTIPARVTSVSATAFTACNSLSDVSPPPAARNRSGRTSVEEGCSRCGPAPVHGSRSCNGSARPHCRPP